MRKMIGINQKINTTSESIIKNGSLVQRSCIMIVKLVNVFLIFIVAVFIGCNEPGNPMCQDRCRLNRVKKSYN